MPHWRFVDPQLIAGIGLLGRPQDFCDITLGIVMVLSQVPQDFYSIPSSFSTPPKAWQEFILHTPEMPYLYYT